MKITLIRHGLTNGNLQKRYIGTTNEGLCNQGIIQLNENAVNNKYPQCKELYCSPMLRCIETCQIIYPDVKPCIVDSLREIDFGKFEGKNYKELSNDADYNAWIQSNGTMPFPDGESRDDFISRSLNGFNYIISISKADNISIVCHGGNIMAVLSHYTKKNYYDFQIANADGFICDINKINDDIIFNDIRNL